VGWHQRQSSIVWQTGGFMVVVDEDRKEKEVNRRERRVIMGVLGIRGLYFSPGGGALLM